MLTLTFALRSQLQNSYGTLHTSLSLIFVFWDILGFCTVLDFANWLQVALKYMRSINAGVQRQIQQEVPCP